MENLNEKLPEFFRPLFWFLDFGSLDLEAHRKTIILNSINYGTLEHWKWIKRHYGEAAVRGIFKKLPATEFKKRSGRLCELLFDFKLNYAPRSAR